MKYVVTNYSAIVFDERLVHAHVARGQKVLGAGFVNIVCVNDKMEARCSGESISLGIPSRRELDEAVINNMLNRFI